MRFYARKIIGFAITLALVSLITFGVFQILPGDPATVILGVDADPAQIEALHESMGLDLPPIVRYLNWIGGLFKGDLGESYRYHQPVSELLSSSFVVTSSLTVVSLALTLLIGLPIGIWLAKKNENPISTPVSVVSQISLSVPAFCMGILLISIFCVKLKWFPSIGFTDIKEGFGKWLKGIFLPSLAISLGAAATLIRYIRSGMVTQMSKDYVKTARSKGVTEGGITRKHVLRNALIPVITILGMLVADILGGSIIIENVFSLPGIGKLISTAINTRDFPLIQGLVLYLAMIVVICNFFVDILYSIVDPRIRLK